ncbi:hypothetical protein bpmyx0001_30150 [Bacillus pseudomycoides DSM 12442]|nr:hypothetical protein bpmyx0001_30150 [Bacillus pseudomycoides DSM 12442]
MVKVYEKGVGNMESKDQFQTYEVPWNEFTNALRSEMEKQVGADIIDQVVCDLKDGFEVYTYIQGDLDFEYKEELERKFGSDGKIPNLLTVMLLASIYHTSEENIRLHADRKDNPIVEVYVKQ